MLPAGFEPASEARKAPILDRARLRERKAGFVTNPINAFGNGTPWRSETGNLLDATSFDGGNGPREADDHGIVVFPVRFLVIIVGWLADLLGVFELNTVT